MSDASKEIKRLLREHAALAYEEELRQALAPLAAAFDQWKEGKVSSDKINDMIHEFHQGPHRELYLRYSSKMWEPTVAHAIAAGILNREKVPIELMEYLARRIEFYKKELKESKE